MYIPMCIICPGGVIGRRERLKISWRRLREGSIPFPGILVLVAELADALDLGSNVERCAGSSPVGDIRCIFEQNI